jgi:hypothetical protein
MLVRSPGESFRGAFDWGICIPGDSSGDLLIRFGLTITAIVAKLCFQKTLPHGIDSSHAEMVPIAHL